VPLSPVAPLPGEKITTWPQGVDTAVNPMIAAWTDFSSSFTITAVTTNPGKGTSTYIAHYLQRGKTVDFFFSVGVGFSSGGSGAYRFLLPVTANASLIGMGPAWVNDTGTAFRVGVCTFVNTTHVEIYLSNITGAALGDGGPGTVWAIGDVIKASITYEAA
jgi:hypothetical protein